MGKTIPSYHFSESIGSIFEISESSRAPSPSQEKTPHTDQRKPPLGEFPHKKNETEEQNTPYPCHAPDTSDNNSTHP